MALILLGGLTGIGNQVLASLLRECRSAIPLGPAWPEDRRVPVRFWPRPGVQLEEAVATAELPRTGEPMQVTCRAATLQHCRAPGCAARWRTLLDVGGILLLMVSEVRHGL